MFLIHLSANLGCSLAHKSKNGELEEKLKAIDQIYNVLGSVSFNRLILVLERCKKQPAFILSSFSSEAIVHIGNVVRMLYKLADWNTIPDFDIVNLIQEFVVYIWL